jgi:hypothetical protein
LSHGPTAGLVSDVGEKVEVFLRCLDWAVLSGEEREEKYEWGRTSGET